MSSFLKIFLPFCCVNSVKNCSLNISSWTTLRFANSRKLSTKTQPESLCKLHAKCNLISVDVMFVSTISKMRLVARPAHSYERRLVVIVFAQALRSRKVRNFSFVLKVNSLKSS